MSSSQSARLILLALWLIGTLLLTSAQLRVIAAPPPRRWRYVVAWVVCTLIGGGLLSVVDNLVGRIDWSQRIANATLAGAVCAAALGAGAWLTRQPHWHARHGVVRFLALAMLHALIVLILGFPFM